MVDVLTEEEQREILHALRVDAVAGDETVIGTFRRIIRERDAYRSEANAKAAPEAEVLDELVDAIDDLAVAHDGDPLRRALSPKDARRALREVLGRLILRRLP